MALHPVRGYPGEFVDDGDGKHITITGSYDAPIETIREMRKGLGVGDGGREAYTVEFQTMVFYP